MKNPAVTVLMSVRDGMPYLPAALDSIWRQEFTDFELLLINDGSKDGTGDYLAGIRDPRLRVIRHETSAGLIASLNEGLGAARGDLIARVDADDLNRSDRLGKQVALFRDGPGDLALVASSVKKFGAERGRNVMPVAHDEIVAGLMFSFVLPHPAAMLNRQFLEKHDLRYPTWARHAEDYAFWVEIAGRGRTAGIAEDLVDYRVHASSISRQNGIEQEKNAALCRAIQVRRMLGLEIASEEATDRHRILAGASGYRASSAAELAAVESWKDRMLMACGGNEAAQAEIRRRWLRCLRRAKPGAILERAMKVAGWRGVEPAYLARGLAEAAVKHALGR